MPCELSFSSLFDGHMYYSWTCVEYQALFLPIFEDDCFLGLGQFPYTYVLIRLLKYTQYSAAIWGALCISFHSVLCPMKSSCLVLLRLSVLSLRHGDPKRLQLFPPPCALTQKLSQGNKQGSSQGSLCSLSRITNLLCLMSMVLKTLVSHILSFLSPICFRQAVNPVPFTPSCLSGITNLHCLISMVLKTIVSCILSPPPNCFRQEVDSVSVTPSWLQAEVRTFFYCLPPCGNHRGPDL